MARRLAAAAVALAAAAALLGCPAAFARARFDVQVLAHVGAPGQPGLSLIGPDRFIYVGTFTNASGAANGASNVFAYSPDGRLLRTYPIKGQDPNADNGVQVAAMDAHGLLYLLDQHPARVITLDPRTGAQSNYASFKDVPTCPSPGIGNECSATVMDNAPEPDYAACGPTGELYVTDYQQGLVWRVPPGGGVAHVWFTDPQLDGSLFGPAQITMLPDHRTLMLDTSAGGVMEPDNTSGKLYTLGINPDGTPGTLHKLWTSGPTEGPDGFALAQSGNVYMALVGPQANQLVEISPTGQEIARVTHDGSNGPNDVPFDEPSSVAFDGERMIVTNDAYFSGDSTHFVLFDVFAGEPGAPIFIPHSAGMPVPAVRKTYKVSARPRRVRVGRRRIRVHATVRDASGSHALRARVKLAGTMARTNSRGDAVLSVRLRHAGSYALRLLGSHRRTLAKTTVRVRR
jgi:hypothetical protein